jgi:hypothetical protein
MKRISIPVDTLELCSYGCGSVAKFKNGSGNLMCCESHSSCPTNKKKNSDGIKIAYKSGKIDPVQRYKDSPDQTKNKMNWNKGKYAADFSYNGKGSHKLVLIEERGHRCESCELETWLGKEITLEMDHADGDRKNNVKENLRLLCPNCHSFTHTWRGRNINPGIKKISDEVLVEALKTSPSIFSALNSLGLAGAGNYKRCENLIEIHNIRRQLE